MKPNGDARVLISDGNERTIRRVQSTGGHSGRCRRCRVLACRNPQWSK
jgi:hypothetical protein